MVEVTMWGVVGHRSPMANIDFTGIIDYGSMVG